MRCGPELPTRKRTDSMLMRSRRIGPDPWDEIGQDSIFFGLKALLRTSKSGAGRDDAYPAMGTFRYRLRPGLTGTALAGQVR